MSDHEWLQKIIAAPNNASLRIDYANHLMETEGDVAQKARAEFIRLGCDLLSMKDNAQARLSIQRLDELKSQHGLAWVLPLARACSIPETAGARGLGYRFFTADALTFGSDWSPTISMGWRGGFVEELTCPVDTWMQYGDKLKAQTPICKVTLTTVADGATFHQLLSKHWNGILFQLPAFAK